MVASEELIPPVRIAIDFGVPNGDRTAEVHYRQRPDGTIEVIEAWSYTMTICPHGLGAGCSDCDAEGGK